MSRPWNEYAGEHLDYDELKKREQQRLEYIQSKRAADDAAIDAKKHKAMKILSAFVAVTATVAIVYAITHQTASPNYNQPVTIRDEFSADLTGQIATPEMGSGDEITY